MSVTKVFQNMAYNHMGIENIEGGPVFKNLIEKIPKNGDYPRYSASWYRANNFNVMKYGFPLRSLYTTASFRVTYRGDRKITNCIYGLTYWPTNTDIKKMGINYKTVEPEFLCIGGSFISQDGEYKKHFLKWEEYNKVYTELTDPKNTDGIKIIDHIENGLLKLIQDGNIVIDVEIYPTENESEISNRIDELRIPIKLLVSGFMISYEFIYNELHLVEDYTKTFINISNYINLKEISENSSLVIQKINRFIKYGKLGRVCRINLGQKIIPMMLSEITDFNNLRYPAVRELWISEILSDFKLNGRSNAFPYFNNWTMISDVNEGLYDNESVKFMYKTSDVTNFAVDKIKHIQHKIKEEEHKLKPKALSGFNHQLYLSVKYAENNNLLSNISLVMVNENTGITLGSLRLFKYIIPENLFNNILIKPLFDIVFGTLSMHHLCIHSDMHKNNMTLYRTMYSPKNINNKCSLYFAGDTQLDAYIVFDGLLNGHIIDFSRAIISPEMREGIEKDIGKEQAELMYKEQIDRIVAALRRVEPSFVSKYEERIRDVSYFRPLDMYYVLSAVDYVSIGRSAVSVLEEFPEDLKHLTRGKNETVAKKLYSTARKELLQNLHSVVIKGETMERTAQDIGRHILSEVFDDLRFPNWDSGDFEEIDITDAFNANAPLNFKGNVLDKFPPWADLKLVEKKLGTPIMDESAEKRLSNVMESRVTGEMGNEELDILVEEERSRSIDNAPLDPDATGTRVVI